MPRGSLIVHPLPLARLEVDLPAPGKIAPLGHLVEFERDNVLLVVVEWFDPEASEGPVALGPPFAERGTDG